MFAIFFTYFDCNIYTLFHKLARIIIAIASLEKGYHSIDLWMLILEIIMLKENTMSNIWWRDHWNIIMEGLKKYQMERKINTNDSIVFTHTYNGKIL